MWLIQGGALTGASSERATGTGELMRQLSAALTGGGRYGRALGVVLVIVAVAGAAGCAHVVSGHATSVGTDSASPKNRAELMARARKVDPCSLFDVEAAKQYGQEVETGRTQLDGLGECSLEALTGGKPTVRFRVTLATELSLDDAVPSRGSRVVVVEPERTTTREGAIVDSCNALAPSGVADYGATLHALVFTQPGATPAAGPEHACDVATETLTVMVPAFEHPVPVAPTTSGPVLYGKNPCDALDRIAGALPGAWRTGLVYWTSEYHCASVLEDPAAKRGVLIEVEFDRDAEQDLGTDAGHVTIGGLSGMELGNSAGSNRPDRPDSRCMVSLNYRRETAYQAWDAHIIDVNLEFVARGARPDEFPMSKGGKRLPFDLCAETEHVASMVVAAAG